MIVVLLVAAMILNIVAGAFLFLDIQQMNLPEITLTLEIVNITATEAILQPTITVHNPNSFPIFLKT